MRTGKRLLAGLLSILLIGLVVVGMQTKVDAADNTMKTHYDDTYSIAKFWDDRKAPIKNGYVFGGWYQKNDTTYTPLKEADLVKADLESLTNVCAKFVPAYVLSVKAQMEATTQSNNGNTASTYLRLITALDSKEYQKVNFEIYYNNKHKENNAPDIDKLFSRLKNADGEITPETTFGPEAHCFGALKLNAIVQNNYTKIIYARPSWTTMDGTTVEGLGKYIRVEDGFVKNEYISVPVNLLGCEEVAAGKLQFTYDAKTLRVYDVDAGRLMPEMEVNHNDSGVIVFVGNTDSGNVEGNGLYANVRFKKIPESELGTGVEYPDFWDFSVSNEVFCNWSEAIVEDLKAWDSRY